MQLPLQDLNGPQRGEAEEIVRAALDLDFSQARRLELAWDTPGTGDNLLYLQNCRAVWDALEESGRFLPLGWFEAIFADCSWAEATRALHSVADAVCSTLVRDLIPTTVYEAMIAPWRTGMVVSVN